MCTPSVARSTASVTAPFPAPNQSVPSDAPPLTHLQSESRLSPLLAARLPFPSTRRPAAGLRPFPTAQHVLTLPIFVGTLRARSLYRSARTPPTAQAQGHRGRRHSQTQRPRNRVAPGERLPLQRRCRKPCGPSPQQWRSHCQGAPQRATWVWTHKRRRSRKITSIRRRSSRRRRGIRRRRILTIIVLSITIQQQRKNATHGRRQRPLWCGHGSGKQSPERARRGRTRAASPGKAAPAGP